MRVIFHCSDSFYGNAALLTKWQVLPAEKVIQGGRVYHGNGWSAIGYHYVILNGWLDSGMYNRAFDGHLETGRPLDDDHIIGTGEIGAHTRGHNRSVGICLIGRSGDFTESQIETAKRVLNLLKGQFREIEIFQHSDFDPKKPHCAGLDLSIFYGRGII